MKMNAAQKQVFCYFSTFPSDYQTKEQIAKLSKLNQKQENVEENWMTLFFLWYNLLQDAGYMKNLEEQSFHLYISDIS